MKDESEALRQLKFLFMVIWIFLGFPRSQEGFRSVRFWIYEHLYKLVYDDFEDSQRDQTCSCPSAMGENFHIAGCPFGEKEHYV